MSGIACLLAEEWGLIPFWCYLGPAQPDPKQPNPTLGRLSWIWSGTLASTSLSHSIQPKSSWQKIAPQVGLGWVQVEPSKIWTGNLQMVQV